MRPRAVPLALKKEYYHQVMSLITRSEPKNAFNSESECYSAFEFAQQFRKVLDVRKLKDLVGEEIGAEDEKRWRIVY